MGLSNSTIVSDAQLIQAAQQGHSSLAAVLNNPSGYFQTTLQDSYYTVKYNINCRDQKRNTLLHLCVKLGDIELVKLVLRHPQMKVQPE